MVAAKLKVVILPVRVVWYCRQVPWGACGLVHSIWVTLMSHVRWVVVPWKVKARVAVSPLLAPMSMYTGGQRKKCLNCSKCIIYYLKGKCKFVN